jgi:hypothetical protein
LPWICQNSQRHICNKVLLNQNTRFRQQPTQTQPNQPDIRFNMALDDMTIAWKRGWHKTRHLPTPIQITSFAERVCEET